MEGRTPTIASRTVYERLANGLDLYVLPTTSKGLVVMQLAFPGGVRRAPNTVHALLLASMLPGATKREKRAVVLERLEDLGATVSVRVGEQELFVTLTARAAVAPHALEIVIEAFSDTRISSDECSQEIARLKVALTESEEDTGRTADTTLMRTLFAPGHPHHSETPSELAALLPSVSAQSLLAYHRDTFSATGAFACVAGDFSDNKLRATVAAHLGSIPQRAPTREVSVDLLATRIPQEYDHIVTRHHKMNVDTVLGLPLSLTRDHPDFIALTIAVRILGGSSQSRLFNTLRTKESLTYGAYASLGGFDDGYPGYLKARAIFPNDVFLRGRSSLRRVVAEFLEKGVTARELAMRKEEVAGRHKVGLATTAGVCAALFAAVRAGREPSYVDEYPTRVSELTLKQVNGAIAAHCDASLTVTAASGSVDAEGKPTS